jgi:hypothetical protein
MRFTDGLVAFAAFMGVALMVLAVLAVPLGMAAVLASLAHAIWVAW